MPTALLTPHLEIPCHSCYAIYNAALYWSPVVREEYERTHSGYAPAVHANDVFFALVRAKTGLPSLSCVCPVSRPLLLHGLLEGQVVRAVLEAAL